MKYVKGTVHDCFQTIVRMLFKTQRVLAKKKKKVDEMVQQMKELNLRHNKVRDQLEQIHMEA